METIEAPRPELADMFAAVCDAAKIPAGSARIDVFLQLPKRLQDATWIALAARRADEEAAQT